MNHRQSAGLGIALLLLAAGLALRPKGTPDAGRAATATATGKHHHRGAMTGTTTQRMDRFRAVWHSLSQGTIDPRQLELAHELIQSLPAASLKELLIELAPGPAGMPELLAGMARRLGDLDAERGVQWLAGQAADHGAPFEPLFQPALDGWSDSDPLGLLGAFFDDDKSLDYRIRRPENSTWGDDGIAPAIVAKAAERDPDEVWLLLRKWQRRTLGDDFFAGLDPSQAPHFAARIKDLFQNTERPGFEHLGGTVESWAEEQQVRRSAATAWFCLKPEEALAWFDPAAGNESDQGEAAGKLGSRFYLAQPQRAMEWLGAKSPAFRAAAAVDLSYDLVAGPDVPDARLDDLTVFTGWMDEGAGRRRWLLGLPDALAQRQQGHRFAEVAESLLARLDLTADELAILETQRP